MTREEAIELLEDIKFNSSDYSRDVEALQMAIEALKEPEAMTLTYNEKCIFLAAIRRERQICKEMDEEPELNKIKRLIPIVDSIERKVKAVLWGSK